MTKEEKITLTLKGSMLTYQKEITEDLASQVISLCSLPQEAGSQVGSSVAKIQIRPKTGPQESVAEYMMRHAPKRNPDKILTLAGYLREIQKKSSFFPNEIKLLFRDAGETLPANFGRDFQWVVNSSWIARDPEKKEVYYVTSSGIKVLEAGFSNEMIKESRNKFSGRRKAKKPNQK